VLVSARRDAKTARRFFQQVIGGTFVAPTEVTTDQAPVYPVVLEERCQGLAPHRPVCQQPSRMRPRPAEGAAAIDA
jgi:transposase-like protein